MLVDELIPSATAILFQLLLDRVEHRGFDDGFMLSLVEQILVANQAGVQGIGQQRIDRAFIEGFSTARKAAFRLPLFVQPTTLVDVLDDREQGPEFLVEREDTSDPDRFFGIDDQLGACAGSIDIVAKDRDTTGPFPFSALGSDFVADPLADDLSLELGKGQQDIQRQPAHRVGRVELLGYRDEGNTVFIERFHDPGEVHERAAKSIDFVDHHAIDLSAFDVFEESIESRSIEATARETTVVVLLRQALGERH